MRNTLDFIEKTMYIVFRLELKLIEHPVKVPQLSKASLEAIGRTFIHIGEAVIIASIVALVLPSDRGLAWWKSVLGMLFGVLPISVGIFFIERSEKKKSKQQPEAEDEVS